jgi:hypothetical protein
MRVGYVCPGSILDRSVLTMKSRNAKPGRPRKPYRASWGEHINGLRKRGDGRWQIVDTGQAFVESDERLAVLRFRQWESNKENQKILLNADSLMEIKFNKQENGKFRISTKTLPTMGWVAEAELWAWFREQLITRPEFVADQVGIPELARLADLPKQVTLHGLSSELSVLSDNKR